MAIKIVKGKVPKVKYKDWLINQKYVPEEGDEEYDDFWEKQEYLCKHGCYIEDVYFPGFLYWHLNVWKDMVTQKDEFGQSVEVYTNVDFRDTEWLVFNEIDKAEKAEGGKKGLPIGGARRLGKSSIIASYLVYGICIDQNSQNVLAGSNEDDIAITTNKIEKGLSSVPPYFRWDRIEKKKNQWVFGVKKPDGTNVPFSYFIIRNLSEGRAEEALAGLKPRKLVFEEAAKNPFVKCLRAAIPGFTTPYGWGCTPIAIYTGGNAEKFGDAKKLHMNPSGYNFLDYPDPHNPDRRVGLTLLNRYRYDAKDETTFGAFLGIENLKSDLYNIPFWVANEEKAEKALEKELEAAKSTNDTEEYNKVKMYYPKTVDDIFLNIGKNIFNSDIARVQQIKIETNGITGTPVELYHDGERVRHKISSKQVITEFPVSSQSKDAPIVIYEHPVPNPPKFLYTAGVDPYKHQDSEHSSSLGSVYIYKRIHSLTGEGLQNSIVASYTARPDSMSDWEEQSRLLIMYYNAYALVENDELSFINYMKHKKCADLYLSPQPKFQNTAVPNSTQKRDFGCSRAAAKVRDLLHRRYKNYMEEIIDRKVNEEGVVISETYGVSRIPDPMLLEETIKYGPEVNTDRLVAFELALALAEDLDPLLGTFSSTKTDDRNKALNKVASERKSTFSSLGSMFGSAKRVF